MKKLRAVSRYCNNKSSISFRALKKVRRMIIRIRKSTLKLKYNCKIAFFLLDNARE